ncbi:hypothetical protein Gotri_014430, partial [Gossypium trilobum]|nr:hypothetical protein [Gossypium trilobum]
AITITPTEGIFDPSRHSAVVFKENNRPGFLASALENNNNGRKLNRIIKDRCSTFKASSPKILLAKSISSIVDLLHSQFQQGLATKIPKRVGEKSEAQKGTRQ